LSFEKRGKLFLYYAAWGEQSRYAPFVEADAEMYGNGSHGIFISRWTGRYNRTQGGGVRARTRVGRDDVITPGNISFASVGLA
jgi:hypothetical protein